MTLSAGAATDRLVTLATAAITGVTVNGKPVLVSDGQPDELAFGMLVIGLEQPPPDGTAEIRIQRDWSPIGDRHIDEDYVIPCYIDVRVSGNTQKTARDAAVAIFNAFWAGIVADPTLGGVLQGTGYPAVITNVVSVGVNVGSVAEPGRRALITFDVHCLNLTR